MDENTKRLLASLQSDPQRVQALFRSGDGQTLGVQVPLDTLEKYAGLVPDLVLPGVDSIGLVPVRCPQENTVDGSPDAVSVYAPAAGLIHNVNRNEAQLDREFENGRSRVFASADLFKTGADGRKRLDDDLFVGLDDDPETVGVTVFSPTLREASFLARKTEYLRNVESLIGLKRGILSDVEAAERTATEVTSSAGDYNLTIIDFQRMWESAAREAVRVCEILGRLYKVFSGSAVDPEKDVTIEYKSEHAEVVAALAEDQTAVGLLPQPFVTTALMKNENLRVALDLNELWESSVTDGSKLVTGVVIARNDYLKEHEADVDAFMDAYKTSV